MDLTRYAQASLSNAEELEASLTDSEILALAEGLKLLFEKYSPDAWDVFSKQHEEDIDAYIISTPSQRKAKKWAQHKLRSYIVLASIHRCYQANALQDTISNYSFYLSGGAYRSSTAMAGKIFQALASTEIILWPDRFDNLCPSPFENFS